MVDPIKPTASQTAMRQQQIPKEPDLGREIEKCLMTCKDDKTQTHITFCTMKLLLRKWGKEQNFIMVKEKAGPEASINRARSLTDPRVTISPSFVYVAVKRHPDRKQLRGERLCVT